MAQATPSNTAFDDRAGGYGNYNQGDPASVPVTVLERVRTRDHVRKNVNIQHRARCSACDAMLAQQNASEAIVRVTEGRNGAIHRGWRVETGAGRVSRGRTYIWCTRCRPRLSSSCEAASPKLQRSCTSYQTRTATGFCPLRACRCIAVACIAGPARDADLAAIAGLLLGPAVVPRKPPSASDASLLASTPADEPWPASLVQYEQLRPAAERMRPAMPMDCATGRTVSQRSPCASVARAIRTREK